MNERWTKGDNTEKHQIDTADIENVVSMMTGIPVQKLGGKEEIRLKQVSLFDVYRGDKIPEGKKQYAINFVLQDPEKTLTDQEVEKAMSRLLATFQNQFGAVLR